MGVKDTYNARLGFQSTLDELFPRGAWITVLTEVSRKLQPTGVEMTVGRVFCSDAFEDDGGWHYQLFFDPRFEELIEGEYAQPYTCWIAELDGSEEPMFEAEILRDDEAPLEVLRIRNDPAGPRRVLPGQRDFVTELRENELFPRGMSPLELEVIQ